MIDHLLKTYCTYRKQCFEYETACIILKLQAFNSNEPTKSQQNQSDLNEKISEFAIFIIEKFDLLIDFENKENEKWVETHSVFQTKRIELSSEFDRSIACISDKNLKRIIKQRFNNLIKENFLEEQRWIGKELRMLLMV